MLTTHRLIYAKEGRPTVAVPLAGITDITTTRSRLTGHVLKIVAVGGAYGWENLARADTFVDTLRNAVAAAVATAATAQQDTGEPAAPRRPDSPSMLDELARLAVLHRHGALTDDEFVRAKRRSIGGRRHRSGADPGRCRCGGRPGERLCATPARARSRP
ncbi:SHOCT domain-containing protein [Embleya sp. NPDC050154]|uniref:SHOCT domain-containing protein n=1 Tax=Embleya sp. NPDC050154 TaxID=3363988 RepID=UPI00379F393A